MTIESFFELVGLLGSIVATYYFLSGGFHTLQNAKKAFVILLIVSVAKYFINALEWSGLLGTINLDYIEDYLDDIWPFAWFLFFFTSLMDTTTTRLRESENRYRIIFNSSKSAITIMDKLGNFVDFNETTTKMTGYEKDEIKYLKINKLYNNLDNSLFLSSKNKNSDTIEASLCRKDGTFIETEYKTHLIIIDDKEYIQITINDITDRKHAERSFLENQKLKNRWKKMESVGLLAGGVAHDLNNILSGMISYPELILLDLPESSNLRKPLKAILDSGKKSAAIVNDLLTVARGVAIKKEPLNLNNIINDYIQSHDLEELKKFHSMVEFKICLDENLLNLKGSETHLRKALMNLVSNASEAVEGNGSVVVSTNNCYLDKPLRLFDEVKPGEYVLLSVSDTGPGIAEEDLDRIFEPFYTKKKMGRSGTGLGLAVVWNVVHDHGGYIDVKIENKGTKFELYFPIIREDIDVNVDTSSISDFMGNNETILVVDDVKSQRELVCAILKKIGYKSISVSGGEEAIEYVKKQPVDLIILDMIMDPGINGRQAYEKIIEIRPNQKAIVASGFAETEDVEEVLRMGAGQYIKKPFTLKMLGQAIKKEIEK